MAERTEAPTQKRLEEARQRGQVAKSSEVAAALGLLAGCAMLGGLAERVSGEVASLARACFGGLAAADPSEAAVLSGAAGVAGRLALAMAPFVGVSILVGVGAHVAQSGVGLSPGALKPAFHKVNPLSGLKRIFSTQGLAELVKALLKIALIGYVAYGALRAAFPALLALPGGELGYWLGAWQGAALGLGQQVAAVLVVLAALDYLLQRYQWLQGLRMTRQEVREEMRQAQGDPMLRGRMRQRQRQFAMNRMMADVPKADVVVTNPTHLAVALCYDAKRAAAPVVVAKGERLVAEKIKETARTHRVPVVENVPLARALFQAVEVGHEIPAALYDAVAGVLAFVYSMNARGRA